MSITCDNRTYDEGIYDSSIFYQHTDYTLGFLLVLIGFAGGVGNIFSVVLLLVNRNLVKVKVTWALFLSMAAVDATQFIPAMVCGILLFSARTPNVNDVVQLSSIRIGGFISNVFPFIAQLLTLLFTATKVFVYIFPFQSRYLLTLPRTMLGIVGCVAVNLALEGLLFSPAYDFSYYPCTGILRVEVDQGSPTLFYYAWIRLILSLMPFMLTIFGNILLGFAVYKSHRTKLLLAGEKYTLNSVVSAPNVSSSGRPHQRQTNELDNTEKRTLVTAFLLVVTNVLGYSLQNGILFCYLISYPKTVSNVTPYPAYERLISDLLLPACNAAANSAVYIFHYLPTLQKAKQQLREEREIDNETIKRISSRLENSRLEKENSLRETNNVQSSVTNNGSSVSNNVQSYVTNI